jgi:hypothetical protein
MTTLAASAASPTALNIPGLAGLEPVLLTLHLLGIVFVVGSVIVMDLRLLGFGASLPVRQLHRFIIPFSLAALLIVVPSGLALFALHAATLIGRPTFFYKMLLLFAAAINALIFYTGAYQGAAGWDTAKRPPAGARWAGALSILIWIAVIYCGQSLAHPHL